MPEDRRSGLNDSGLSLKSTLRDRGLLPFQVKFIETFLKPDSPRAHVLQALPGTGITLTIAELIQTLHGRGDARKVLILTRRPLAQQTLSVLRRLEIPSVVVDRFRFREWE